MNAVLNCIFNRHDRGLLTAAVLLCLLACIAVRAMVLRAGYATGYMRCLWLVSAGLVFGAGVWATHFVLMIAFTSGVEMTFAPGLTLASVALAMILSAAGFFLSFTRAGGAAGGLVVGAAVVAMHFSGMAALNLPATPVWNAQGVFAAILIGLSVSALAGHVAALTPSLASNVATVVLRAATVIGTHFTAMSAVRYLPTGEATPANALSPQVLAIMVMAVAAFIVAQALLVALLDLYLYRRASGEAERMRAYIAELEKTRAELHGALDAAEAAGKAKAAFFASMSHELRTPLNAVIGFSDIMIAETFGPLSDRYKEYTGDVRASGVKLLSVINDILDISRFDAGHAELAEELFDPAVKLEDVTRMMARQAAMEKVSLTCEIPPGLPRVRADKRRIRQIMLNLLSNALKFTPAGGAVTVRAVQGPDGLDLIVQDTGIGIASGDMQKALEPFGQIDSRLARKYEGTGLGLPLTRQMTELHGGSLTLDSAPGHGTTVTVSLPAWRLEPQEQVA